MVDRPLRQLDQLPADGRACRVAAVAGAFGAAARRRIPDQPPHRDQALMGWAILLLLVALSLAGLRLAGLRGGMLQATAAALLFGSAGYALQGHPELRGSPAAAAKGDGYVPLAEARHAFFGNF